MGVAPGMISIREADYTGKGAILQEKVAESPREKMIG
jgi:hypothetical protein